MTQRTPKVTVRRNRTLALVSALVKGVVAAGLGLGSLTVLVMVVWISSPYPDSGPGEALRAAAGVWLLAHGAGLVRPDTLSGVPAPVGLVPLLLVLGPVWLAHRAARDAAESQEELREGAHEGARDGSAGPSRAGAFCAVTAGYLLVVAGAAAYARGGPLYADPDTLAFPVALVVAGAAAAGVWTAAGRPFGPAPSWSPLAVQEAVARTLFRRRAEAAFRSAAAGLTVLLGGGALLVAVALGRNAGATQDAFLGLAGDWSGRIAVLLLAAALVPNAALWGAAYGLGPGFSLGTGATATPLGLDGTPALPRFPLLAAVPDQGPGALPNGAALAVPVAAALAVAWFAVRRAAPADAPRARAWSPRETVLVTLLAALACGAGTALLTAVAGGPIGSGALSAFGPVWWLTGPAALVWTAVIGVPAALLMRLWRLRTPGWAWRRDVPEADEPPTAEVDVEEEGDDEEGGDRAGRPRRWWAPWRGRCAAGEGGETGPGAPASPAASSVPPPGPAPEAASGFEPYDFLPTDPWHEKDGPWHGNETREARWASLKQGSGGLMADFPAERTADRAGRTDRADRADPVPDRRAADPDGPGATP
ncbi:cell division protein PerM [Streptomyces rubiginosohelvolus]|uniref:cell division protein PerM n=1 Tax=Streptomyces rubiginosohelvolus TaxID=67362 RepID=UPI0035D8DD93